LSYTVVIPAHNAAPHIGATIRSVLEQTQLPAAIIVVDDGSSDDTAAAAAACSSLVQVIRQENAGPGAATTNGFAHVQTEFIATVDADDLWASDRVERQFKVFADEPTVGAVFTRMADFRDDVAHAALDQAYDAWLRSTMLIRTRLAMRVGPVIDPPGAGDMVDWIARLRETGETLVMLPQTLVYRRVHASSMTARGRHTLGAGFLQVARAAMLRRRARDQGGSD
jgi:glycosyltransferase involved in cell wall biosynthesis